MIFVCMFLPVDFISIYNLHKTSNHTASCKTIFMLDLLQFLPEQQQQNRGENQKFSL